MAVHFYRLDCMLHKTKKRNRLGSNLNFEFDSISYEPETKGACSAKFTYILVTLLIMWTYYCIQFIDHFPHEKANTLINWGDQTYSGCHFFEDKI